MKNLAIVTFVYNERKQLPRWFRHYSDEVESNSDLYVIDHGSDDGSIDELPADVNVIGLTRNDGVGSYEVWRVNYASNFVNTLLQEYKAVIYVDCDEYLVVDPLVSASLCDYVLMEEISTHAIGFDVIHDFCNEPPLGEASISVVRRNYQFVAAMCKPCIAIGGKSIVWGPGFHVSNLAPKFGDLYLFHARYADISEGLDRLKITREIFNPELDLASTNHHKISDETFNNWATSWLKLEKSASDITSKLGTVKGYVDSFKFSLVGDIYDSNYALRSSQIFDVPNRFFDKF